MAFQERKYQTVAIVNLRNEMRSYKRIMLYKPTGSGGTEIAMEIIKSALQKGKRVAFICHRIGLIEQASRRFAQAGIVHGIIQADNTHGVDRSVVICSIQTLNRRNYPIVDLMIIDEAHRCMSKQYLALLEGYNNVPVIGLSATPFSRGLGFQYSWGRPFQSMVIAATIRELIDDGWLVDCDIYAPSVPDLSSVKTQRNEFGEKEFNEKQVIDIIDKPRLIGDIVEHWIKYAGGVSTVVFAKNIAHSKHIMEEFLRNGIAAEHVDCYTTGEERDAMYARYNSGITTVLCNVDIVSEGWDSPRTKCVIDDSPTKSLIKWIQRIGRALRKYGDNARAIVFDHSGNCHRLGYPTDDLPLELDDGTKKDTKSDVQSKAEKLPHICPNPSCNFMIPAGVGVCPKCGSFATKTNKITQEAGELKKVDRKPALTQEQKQEIYSSALGLAEKRNKSDGWAAYLYKDIVGGWPNGLEKIPCEPCKKVLDMDTHNRIKYHKGKGKTHDKESAQAGC